MNKTKLKQKISFCYKRTRHSKTKEFLKSLEIQAENKGSLSDKQLIALERVYQQWLSLVAETDEFQAMEFIPEWNK